MRNFALAVVFFALHSAQAAVDPGTAESRTQADLEAALSRVIPRESFIVRTAAQIETVNERQLLEGETITQTPPRSQVSVPILPGFEAPRPVETASAPDQSRQVFKSVEKQILKSLNVQVTYDEAISPEQVDQAKTLVNQYLAMNFGGRAQASFAAIHMLPPPVSTPPSWSSWLPWILTTALGLALIAITFLLFRKNSPKPALAYPSILPNEEEEGVIVGNSRSSLPSQGGRALPGPKPLALPSGSIAKQGRYPALPATRDFVDRRAELLESFLKNAETFRHYFAKLPEAAQLELYAALRGPAFDSLLETLELAIPPGGDTGAPPTEDQMLFYLKNFFEFLQTHSWQSDQFFGFLRQLGPDQLVTLVKQENPLVGALMLKFMRPEQAAAVLSALSSEARQGLLAQFSRISEISTAELVSIEEAVREQLARLPKFMEGFAREDLSFWTRILSQAEHQEEILGDLEKARPELYPKLARYRFRLEDLPSLPQPLVAQVVAEIENDELALALAGLPRDIVSFALAELPANRRGLVSSQISLVTGMPPDRLALARQSVTTRFREVMV